MRRLALGIVATMLVAACGGGDNSASESGNLARFCEIQAELDRLASQLPTDPNQLTDADIQEIIRSFGPLGHEAAQIAPADIRPAVQRAADNFDRGLELYEEAGWDFTRIDLAAAQTLGADSDAANAEIQDWRKDHC